MRRILMYLPVILLFLYACSGSNSQRTVTTENDFKYVDFPDGSIALINNNSSVTYDTLFQEREVHQTGEVFYIVQKADKHFIVKTENGEIEVKGTEFNVKAEKNKLEVEVEKGSVELRAKKGLQLISNGQKALFSVDGKNIKIGKADFAYRKWTKALAKECKKLGHEIKDVSKDTGKEIRKESKEIGKESKKIGKDVGKSIKKLGKELK